MWGKDLSGYYVEKIDRSLANEIIVKNHYLHRGTPSSVAFGLYTPKGVLCGVVTYATPASPSLTKGLVGAENKHLVGELTRLWVDDRVPKNGESFLIGSTMKESGFEVLVSFADTKEGHVGTVYQATNWLYTGLSDRHKEWVLRGHEGKHSRHLFDEWGGIEGAKKLIPERMYQIERSRKHRYVYFNTKSKSRRRHLLSSLKYQVLPYPRKGENNE